MIHLDDSSNIGHVFAIEPFLSLVLGAIWVMVACCSVHQVGLRPKKQDNFHSASFPYTLLHMLHQKARCIPRIPLSCRRQTILCTKSTINIHPRKPVMICTTPTLTLVYITVGPLHLALSIALVVLPSYSKPQGETHVPNPTLLSSTNDPLHKSTTYINQKGNNHDLHHPYTHPRIYRHRAT